MVATAYRSPLSLVLICLFLSHYAVQVHSRMIHVENPLAFEEDFFIEPETRTLEGAGSQVSTPTMSPTTDIPSLEPSSIDSEMPSLLTEAPSVAPSTSSPTKCLTHGDPCLGKAASCCGDMVCMESSDTCVPITAREPPRGDGDAFGEGLTVGRGRGVGGRDNSITLPRTPGVDSSGRARTPDAHDIHIRPRGSRGNDRDLKQGSNDKSLSSPDREPITRNLRKR